jgi:hypothetical protein
MAARPVSASPFRSGLIPSIALTAPHSCFAPAAGLVPPSLIHIGNKNNIFRDFSCRKCKANNRSVILSVLVTVADTRCWNIKEMSSCQ